MKSLLILSILVKFSAQLSQECYDEYAIHTHPTSCCNYPLLIPHEHQDVIECNANCDYSDKCCRQECLYAKLQIFNGEKLNKANLLNVLLQTLKEENARADWKGPIEKSIEKCENFMEWKREKDDKCTTPFYALYILSCVFQQNFLNCPTFNATDDCVETKNYLANENPCGYFDKSKRIVEVGFWYDWQVSGYQKK